MSTCPRCNTRMNYNDETTKVTEYACPGCHTTDIVWKVDRRSTT